MPPVTDFEVLGFGEGTNIVFISTNAGILIVWRKYRLVERKKECRTSRSLLLSVFNIGE